MIERVFATEPTVADAAARRLNDEQQAAASHDGGPLLILAGAGTGKTATLAARVAVLLDRGLEPERILLLTFTRRAAREMLARVDALRGGGRAASRVVGGTFHAIGWQLVRAHAAALRLPGTPTVLDAGDAADLIDLVREERGLAGGRRRMPRKRTLLDIYSRTVNAQRPASEVVAESFPWCADHLDDLLDLFRDYTARKRSLGVLDLDDLLLFWRALAVHAVLGTRLAGRFDHVLVDEYQDVNGLQADIVAALVREHRQLTCVGDDLQAIYGFRSASSDHVLRFEERHPDARVLLLERNYRSTTPILATANAAAAEARTPYPRELRGDAPGGEQPELVWCADEGLQAEAVVERVLAAREAGVELQRQAVLMRAAHHSSLLELELARRRIPFVKYGGIRYLEAAHVKDLLAVLRLVDNRRDEVAWFRVLQLVEGVGPVRARRLADRLGADEVGAGGLAAALLDVASEVPPPAREPTAVLLGAIDAAAVGAVPLEQAVRRLHAALVPLVEARYHDAATRTADLDQLAAACVAAGSIARFAAELAIDPPSSSAALAGPPHLDEEHLVLSTVHSAKGLEWDAVHVIGLSDGLFPSDMALSAPDGLEEERRLFYVALTRARRALHLHVPTRYHHRPQGRDDVYGLGSTSRFVSEPLRATLRETRVEHAGSALDAAAGAEPVEVSLDDLWR
jgi:DNA helicase-2/ATP-dependent DNA helicase PcrA